MIRTEDVDGSLKWSCVDPCMEAREVAGLAEWLDHVAGGFDPQFFAKVENPGLRRCLRGRWKGFTEPNLEFEVPKMHPKSRAPHEFLVRLSQELAPPHIRQKQGMASVEPYTVKFRLDDLDLKEATRSSRAQLAAYPQRYEPQGGYNPPVNSPAPTDG